MREGEPRERKEFLSTSKVLDVEQSCQQDPLAPSLALVERKERKEGACQLQLLGIRDAEEPEQDNFQTGRLSLSRELWKT